MKFLVDILPLGSGSVDPHIFADPDPYPYLDPDLVMNISLSKSFFCCFRFFFWQQVFCYYMIRKVCFESKNFFMFWLNFRHLDLDRGVYIFLKNNSPPFWKSKRGNKACIWYLHIKFFRKPSRSLTFHPLFFFKCTPLKSLMF